MQDIDIKLEKRIQTNVFDEMILHVFSICIAEMRSMRESVDFESWFLERRENSMLEAK